jgi:hypothetical protein
MKPISHYQLVDLFNTRGTVPRGFDDVATGVGATPTEAVQGALALLAGNGWDVNGLGARILAEHDWAKTGSPSYFVSVHVR